MATDAESRLARLLGYLEHDPENLNLIADAASTALDAGDRGAVEKLLERYAAITPLTPPLQNLQGLLAMGEGHFGDAAAIFDGLVQSNPADAALRFNLAFCRTKLNDPRGASELLDETVAAALPQAAALKVQALHQLGDLEGALAFGTGFAERHPEDRDLMSALALVAIDAEEPELARDFALKAGPTHEGLSTLGMLALNESHVGESLALFDRALEAYGDSARALLGKGLVLMTAGDLEAASKHVDRAAEIFGSHLGSWVTSGWAYFAQGDYKTARARFEHALSLDPAFAETQGALAVIDIVENRLDSARRRTDTALRLDRNCLAGALAKSLLLESGGDAKAAQRIREIALNAPLGGSGRTIAQAMAGLAASRPRPDKEN